MRLFTPKKAKLMSNPETHRNEVATTMTSRQRFEKTCRHEAPDRAPIDYMAVSAVTEKLRQFYNVGSERELLDRLGCDFYYLSSRDISQNETSLPIYRGPKLDYGDVERSCPFGIRYRRKVHADKFGVDEAIGSPLARATSPREILDHCWPEPGWFDMEPLLAECEEYSDKVIVGGFWTAIFGNACRLCGMDNLLLNMAMRPEMVKTLINRLTDFYLELNDRAFSALKGKLDVYFFGNDLGTQKSLMFSREMWLDFYFEPYQRLCQLAHGHGLKVMTHSCGAIGPLIPDLIETGVDILDPVQTTAIGMEPMKLKKEFGDRIVFHGAIDTQNILLNETPDGVRKNARYMIDTLGRGGGYIFASCNSLQEDLPLENIDAMYQVAREHRPG